MKYKLFDNEGKIDVSEISCTVKIPSFFGEQVTPNTFNDVVVKTRVFTDGEVVRQDEPKIEEIQEYFINGKKYTHKVDKKTTRTIYLKDYTYAIVYTIAREYMTVGNIHGNFFVTKDVEVYLKNRKDISALRKARKAMKRIEEGNNSVNYNSLFSMMLTSNQNKRNLEFEQIKDSIYTLKK